MKHWTVKADIRGRTDRDKRGILKQIFQALRKDGHASPRLRELMRFTQIAQSLVLYSPRAVVLVCDVLCSFCVKYEIHEVTRVDLDLLVDEHQLHELSAFVPA